MVNVLLSLFIQPPSVEELRRRLVGRQTDSAEAIENRLAKASYELTFAKNFDRVIVNDDLEKAKQETYEIVKTFFRRIRNFPQVSKEIDLNGKTKRKNIFIIKFRISDITVASMLIQVISSTTTSL